MGLDNRVAGKFFTIFDGKFTMKVDAGTLGSKQRTNKLGTVVNELQYDNFTGKLIGVKTQDGTYGKSWIFSFKDNEDVYHLQLSYSNGFATNLLKMLPNVDLTKEMKVQPSVKEVDGKKKSSLFINQNGQSIKHAYTRDQPNGLPPMVSLVVKGNTVWDDTDQLAFLHNMVMTEIVPKLEGFSATQTNTESLAVEEGVVGKGMELEEESSF